MDAKLHKELKALQRKAARTFRNTLDLDDQIVAIALLAVSLGMEAGDYESVKAMCQVAEKYSEIRVLKGRLNGTP